MIYSFELAGLVPFGTGPSQMAEQVNIEVVPMVSQSHSGCSGSILPYQAPGI